MTNNPEMQKPHGGVASGKSSTCNGADNSKHTANHQDGKTPPMQVTLFKKVNAQSGVLKETTWQGFCEKIKNVPAYSSKNDQPLLKLGCYEDNSRKEGSALKEISGIEIDYDAGDVPLAEAAKRLRKAGIEALVCSTFTATSDNHKWRALLPLSKKYDAKHRAAWTAAADKALGNIAASESYTDKQIYFYGRGEGEYLVEHCLGECLDNSPKMREVAADYAMNGKQKPKPKPAANYTHAGTSSGGDKLEEVRSALTALDPSDNDTWTEVMFSIAGSFGEAGYPVFDEWSAAAANYDEVINRKRYTSCIGSSKTIRTVFRMALDVGWKKQGKDKKPQQQYDQSFTAEAVSGAEAEYYREPDIKHQRQQGQSEGNHIKLVSASRIEPKRLEWLWHNNIPKNALTLFVGMPKTGKTMLSLTLAAIVSAGGKYPDGTQALAGKVLFWSGEDDVQDTILPRLKAAGANLDNVMIIDSTVSDGETHPFTPAEDMAMLIDTIERMEEKPVLLIIDPIVSVVKEMNNALEVRRGLDPLRTMAQTYKMAVVGITHFRKSRGESGLGEQIIGSSAFLQVPRVVFYTLKIPESDGQCVFFRGDANMAASDDGFTYAIESSEADFPEHQMVIDTASVIWGDCVKGDDLQALINPDNKGDSSPVQAEAEGLLKEFLTGGEKLKDDIDSEAKRRDITKISLTRAKKALGIKHRKRKKSEPNAGKFVWYFPDKQHVDQADPVEKDDQVDKHDKHTVRDTEATEVYEV